MAEEGRMQREWFPDAIPGLFRVSKAEAAADLDVIQASLTRLEQLPQPNPAEAPVDRQSKKSRIIEKLFREAAPHHFNREEHANLRAALDQVRADTLTLKDAMANLRRDHALALRERVAHEHHFQHAHDDMLATVSATEAVRAQYSQALNEFRQQLDLSSDEADVARCRLEDARALAARAQAAEAERDQQLTRFNAVVGENRAMQDLWRSLIDALYKADSNATAAAAASAAAAADGKAGEGKAGGSDEGSSSSSSSSSSSGGGGGSNNAKGVDDESVSPVDAILRVLSPAQVKLLQELAASQRAEAEAEAEAEAGAEARGEAGSDAAASSSGSAKAEGEGKKGTAGGEAMDDDLATSTTAAGAAEKPKSESSETEAHGAGMSSAPVAGPHPPASSSAPAAATDASSAPAAEGASSAPSALVRLLGPPPQRSKRLREPTSSASASAGTGSENTSQSGPRRRFPYELGLAATGTEGLSAEAAAALSPEALEARKTALQAHAGVLDFDGVFDPQAFFDLLRVQVDRILELESVLAAEAVRSAEASDEALMNARKVELLTTEAEKINTMISRLRDASLQQELAITAQESRTQAVLQELDLVRREKAQLEAQKVADDIKYKSLLDCLAAADVRSTEAENALLDALHELRVLRAGNDTLQATLTRLGAERDAAVRAAATHESQAAAAASAAGAAEAAVETVGADATQLALRLQKQMATTRSLTAELKASEDVQRLQQKEIKKLQKQLADITGTRIGEQIDVLDVLEPQARGLAAAAAAAAGLRKGREDGEGDVGGSMDDVEMAAQVKTE